jgi:hypothetical protein
MVEATGHPYGYIEVRVHAATGDADLAGPWHPITISDPACRGESAVDSANELVEFVIPGVVYASPGPDTSSCQDLDVVALAGDHPQPSLDVGVHAIDGRLPS